MVSKITNRTLITVLPCLNHWLLMLDSSTIDFLKQSYKESMCPCFLDAGTQTLCEWFLATFWPLWEQRNQPGGNHIDKFIKPYQSSPIMGSQLNYHNSTIVY